MEYDFFTVLFSESTLRPTTETEAYPYTRVVIIWLYVSLTEKFNATGNDAPDCNSYKMWSSPSIASSSNLAG